MLTEEDDAFALRLTSMVNQKLFKDIQILLVPEILLETWRCLTSAQRDLLCQEWGLVADPEKPLPPKPRRTPQLTKQITVAKRRLVGLAVDLFARQHHQITVPSTPELFVKPTGNIWLWWGAGWATEDREDVHKTLIAQHLVIVADLVKLKKNEPRLMAAEERLLSTALAARGLGLGMVIPEEMRQTVSAARDRALRDLGIIDRFPQGISTLG